jgi:repressor LexA
MTIGELIKTRRAELGMTLEEVGRNVGVTKSTVRKWELGHIANMRRDKIAKLSRALKISPSDFIAEGGAEPPGGFMPATIPPDILPVPVIGAAAAGLSCHAEENVEYYEYVPAGMLSDDYEYAYLRVKGDSMSPLLREDDLALVRCQTSVDSGDIAVVIIDDEDGVVKRVRHGGGTLELISENPAYPPRRFEGGEVDRVRVFGRVIESKRRF